jgi:hypothetical protein
VDLYPCSFQCRCKLYGDDIVGVCLVQDLDSEVQYVCRRLLGPKAIAEDKTGTWTRLDVLGYVLDIEQRLVSINSE